MRTLADGVYDTCPKHGPQCYMPGRQVEIKNNLVWLVADNTGPESLSWMNRFTVSDFFKVNNLFNKETNRTI